MREPFPKNVIREKKRHASNDVTGFMQAVCSEAGRFTTVAIHCGPVSLEAKLRILQRNDVEAKLDIQFRTLTPINNAGITNRIGRSISNQQNPARQRLDNGPAAATDNTPSFMLTPR
jgi:hypothetical protein